MNQSSFERRSHEANLIAAAQKGDRTALGELLYTQADELARYAKIRIPPAAQSTISPDDVLQETFFMAFRDIGSFESMGKGAFLAWLKTLAKHRIQDHLKSIGRKKRGGDFRRVTSVGESLVNLLNHLVVEADDPLRKASRHEAIQFLNIVLAELPEHYREAIRLRFMDGLSHEEIATRMNLTQDAVHGLLKRAKQRMRTSLGSASAYLSSR